jgi:hypothetical protein
VAQRENITFEEKIKQLSKTVNHNDAIFLGEDHLPDTLQSFFAVSDLAIYFNVNGYEKYNDKDAVIEKLNQLRKLLDNNLVPNFSPESIAVNMCKYYVKEGWSLTTDVMIYLNKIYKSFK